MANSVIDVTNKPHAILLIESKMCDLDSFVKDYLKSILNNQKYFNKIDNGTYFDLIQIDCSDGLLKKEQVEEIINKFSSTSMETAGKKFYIIKSIENSTKQAVNSLLKFLEEPADKVYAVLTTRNINVVLPTIKSRCQTFMMKPELNKVEQKLKSMNVEQNKISIIKNIYFDFNKAISDINNDTFNTLYIYANDLISNKSLANVKKLSEEFKKLDYSDIKLLIKILNYYLKDERLLELEENIKINPSKILLFNKIWQII